MIAITPEIAAEMSGPEAALVLSALEKSRIKGDELIAQGLSEDQLDAKTGVLVASIVFHISSGLRRLSYDDERIVAFLWKVLGPFMSDQGFPRPTPETMYRDPEGAS